MRFKRTKSNCSVCPLRDRKRVWGMCDIDKPTIAVIGEAPGAEEDDQGMPFVGGSGRLLMGKCGEAGIMWKATHRMNVISCRPPNNNILSSEAQEAISACRPGFLEELEAIAKIGVKVVIPVGNTSTQAMGIPGSITKIRGSVYPLAYGLIGVPTYHPSFILRGAWREEPTWVADLRKAKEISLKRWKPPKENFNLFPSVGDVEAFVADAIEHKRLIGVDIEGFKKIMMVGLSRSASDVLVIPFIKQGGKPYWKPAEELRVHKALGRLLKLCPTIYQNAQFDVYALESQGYTVGNVAHDTMLLHHSIHPELPHKLGYIVSIYGETPYWKDIVLQSDEAMWMLDDTEVRTYNARDAAVLHQVLKPMLKDLKEVGTENTYYNFAMKLLRPLMAMKRRGVLVDMKRLTNAQARFKRSSEKLDGKIRKLLSLPESFNFDSPDHMRLLLHGTPPASYQKSIVEIDSYETNSRKKKDSKKYRELIAKVALVDLVEPLGKPGGRIRKTKTGLASCDDGAILTIQQQCLSRLEAMEYLTRPQPKHQEEHVQLEKTLTFIELYRKYSEDHKLATTYTRYPIGEDGRVHASYKIHGTATGRLSCGEPNLQNQPEAVLDIFVAPPGYVIIKADYSNIEVRVMAYLSNEQVLIDAFNKGVNIHDMNTEVMFGITKDHPNWKNIRQACKKFVFGRSYGGSVQGIYYEVITEVPEARLSLAKFKEADDRYFSKLKSYAAWCENQKKIARETRTVMTAFGRKRFLLGTLDEIERQALNCVDYATEALTRTGWKKGNELMQGEEILCFDARSSKLKWEPTLNIKLYPDAVTDGVEFKHPTLSAISTLDHRWIVYDKHAKANRCVTTSRMSRHGDHRIYRTGEYDGAAYPVFRDDYVRLLGWILTDGSFKKGSPGTTVITIAQSPWGNPKKVQMIDTLFDSLGIAVTRYQNKYPGCKTWAINGEVATAIRDLVPGRILSMRLLGMLTGDQCKILLETMMLGDGTTGGSDTHIRFTARDEQRAEMMQILVSLSGYHATYSYRDMSMYRPKIQGRMRNSPVMTGVWIVEIRKQPRTQVLEKHRHACAIHGVWCPIVPSTYFLARRNGTVYVTGNTPTQGTAGEIAEMAIIECHDAFQKKPKLDAHLIVTVHDSILVECPTKNAMPVMRIMKSIMEKKIDINGHVVSFHVDFEVGPSWGETKKVEVK